MSLLPVRCITAVCTCSTRRYRLGCLGADIPPQLKRHHKILDLGSRGIQFHHAGGRNHRQVLGAASDVGVTARRYRQFGMGHDTGPDCLRSCRDMDSGYVCHACTVDLALEWRTSRGSSLCRPQECHIRFRDRRHIREVRPKAGGSRSRWRSASVYLASRGHRSNPQPAGIECCAAS